MIDDMIQVQKIPKEEEKQTEPEVIQILEESDKGGNLMDFTEMMMGHDYIKLN